MMVSMRPLTLDDFSHRVGKPIEVEAGGRRVPLLLAAAQPLPESGRQGGSFRLELFGRPDTPLGQGGFLFLIGEERFNIFVVPLGLTPRGMRYEAIFY